MAGGHGILHHLVRCGNYNKSGSLGDFLAFKNPGRRSQIVKPASGAGTDEYLIHMDSLHAPNLGQIVDTTRGSRAGTDRGDIVSVYRGIDIIGIGVHFPERLAHAHGGQELPGLGIRLNIGGLGPHLDGHIAEHEPFLHGHGRDGGTGEFHAFIDCRILFKVADNVKNDVLGHDASPGRASFEDDLHHFRNSEPERSVEKNESHVGGADSGAEDSQGAQGRRMGIGFHDDRAGGYEAVFDKDLMADSPADIKELIYPLGGAEFPHSPMIIRRLDRGGGGIVVEDKGCGFGFFYLCSAELIKRGDYLEVEVVHFRDIDTGGDNLAGGYAFFSGRPGQDFFDSVHSKELARNMPTTPSSFG